MFVCQKDGCHFAFTIYTAATLDLIFDARCAFFVVTLSLFGTEHSYVEEVRTGDEVKRSVFASKSTCTVIIRLTIIG